MDLFSVTLTKSDIYLRLLTKSDAPVVLDYWLRNKEFHQPFVPLRFSDFYSLATAEVYTDQVQLVENDQQYLFGIFDRNDHQLFGKVGISHITRGVFQNCNICYDADYEHTNRGNVTHAVQMVVTFAFGALALHRIQASIMPHNLASMKVAEKTGFIREGYSENYLQINGQWEDHYIYALTQERHARLPNFMRDSGVINWNQA